MYQKLLIAIGLTGISLLAYGLDATPIAQEKNSAIKTKKIEVNPLTGTPLEIEKWQRELALLKLHTHILEEKARQANLIQQIKIANNAITDTLHVKNITKNNMQPISTQQHSPSIPSSPSPHAIHAHNDYANRESSIPNQIMNPQLVGTMHVEDHVVALVRVNGNIITAKTGDLINGQIVGNIDEDSMVLSGQKLTLRVQAILAQPKRPETPNPPASGYPPPYMPLPIGQPITSNAPIRP